MRKKQTKEIRIRIKGELSKNGDDKGMEEKKKISFRMSNKEITQKNERD